MGHPFVVRAATTESLVTKIRARIESEAERRKVQPNTGIVLKPARSRDSRDRGIDRLLHMFTPPVFWLYLQLYFVLIVSIIIVLCPGSVDLGSKTVDSGGWDFDLTVRTRGSTTDHSTGLARERDSMISADDCSGIFIDNSRARSGSSHPVLRIGSSSSNGSSISSSDNTVNRDRDRSFKHSSSNNSNSNSNSLSNASTHSSSGAAEGCVVGLCSRSEVVAELMRQTSGGLSEGDGSGSGSNVGSSQCGDGASNTANGDEGADDDDDDAAAVTLSDLTHLTTPDEAAASLQTVLARHQHTRLSDPFLAVLAPSLRRVQECAEEMRGDGETARRETQGLMCLLARVLVGLDQHTEGGLSTELMSCVLGYMMEDDGMLEELDGG